MPRIPLARAAHVIQWVEIFREIGTPIERALAEAHLPIYIEEQPNAYVSNILASNFTRVWSTKEGIENIGWLMGERFSISQLSTNITTAIAGAPTLLKRLHAFFDLIQAENTENTGGLLRRGKNTRVFIDTLADRVTNPPADGAWLHLRAILSIVREVLGQTWQPEEITFQKTFPVHDDARRAFPNARILFGQPHTSLLLPTTSLASRPKICNTVALVAPSSDSTKPMHANFAQLLRSLIIPYLGEGRPTVGMTAEICGLTNRTLQRRLTNCGTSFSELVDAARFEVATQLLRDPNVKIIDVAMLVGCEDGSNFSRTVRRTCGLSPKQYQKSLLEGELSLVS